MNDDYNDSSSDAAGAMAQVDGIDHQEPQEGGSFTRNLDTGALIKAEHPPVDQPAQE